MYTITNETLIRDTLALRVSRLHGTSLTSEQ